VSEWSECSSICGAGTKERRVRNVDGTSSVIVDACRNMSGCKWSTGPWEACSATCGRGEQLRSVQCSGNETAGNCDHLGKKPRDHRHCHAPHACPTGAGAAASDSAVASGGQACSCVVGDPVMAVAGVTNAIAAWVVVTLVMHEIVNFRMRWQGSREVLLFLLAPCLILLGCLGSWLVVTTLNGALPHTRGDAGGLDAAYASGQLTVALVSFALQVSALWCFRNTDLGRARKCWKRLWYISNLALCVAYSAVLVNAVAHLQSSHAQHTCGNADGCHQIQHLGSSTS